MAYHRDQHFNFEQYFLALAQKAVGGGGFIKLLYLGDIVIFKSILIYIREGGGKFTGHTKLGRVLVQKIHKHFTLNIIRLLNTGVKD